MRFFLKKRFQAGEAATTLTILALLIMTMGVVAGIVTGRNATQLRGRAASDTPASPAEEDTPTATETPSPTQGDSSPISINRKPEVNFYSNNYQFVIVARIDNGEADNANYPTELKTSDNRVVKGKPARLQRGYNRVVYSLIMDPEWVDQDCPLLTAEIYFAPNNTLIYSGIDLDAGEKCPNDSEPTEQPPGEPTETPSPTDTPTPTSSERDSLTEGDIRGLVYFTNKGAKIVEAGVCVEDLNEDRSSGCDAYFPLDQGEIVDGYKQYNITEWSSGENLYVGEKVKIGAFAVYEKDGMTKKISHPDGADSAQNVREKGEELEVIVGTVKNFILNIDTGTGNVCIIEDPPISDIELSDCTCKIDSPVITDIALDCNKKEVHFQWNADSSKASTYRWGVLDSSGALISGIKQENGGKVGFSLQDYWDDNESQEFSIAVRAVGFDKSRGSYCRSTASFKKFNTFVCLEPSSSVAPVSPDGLSVECTQNGVKLLWNHVPGAASYKLRLNADPDSENSWKDTCDANEMNQNDRCYDDILAAVYCNLESVDGVRICAYEADSIEFNTQYGWWVYAVNEQGESDAKGGERFLCDLSVVKNTPTPTPVDDERDDDSGEKPDFINYPSAKADIIGEDGVNSFDWSYAIDHFGEEVTINGKKYRITGYTISQILKSFKESS